MRPFCISANDAFALNQLVAVDTGGGIYALSVDLNVTGSAFAANRARSGGAIATDCESEVCIGQLPRDDCATQAMHVGSTRFDRNNASADGGGIHIANHLLRLTTAAGSRFNSNGAVRGEAVFAEPSATVLVDDKSGAGASGALFPVIVGSNGNMLAYGEGIASQPEALAWQEAPVVAAESLMAGTNLCEAVGDGGCVVTMLDRYGNTPTIPTVVEIVPTSDGVALTGPRYVLVADGYSDPDS